jgi:hypothetical protein
LFEKTTQAMKQKVLFIVMLVFIYSGVFSQDTKSVQNETIVVTEINSLLASSRNSGAARTIGTPSKSVELQRLNDLVTQVQSSIYFYQSEVKTFGNSPTNLYTDASSLGQINNSITEKQNIEIVTILINTEHELNSVIDLAPFSNFPNLKYLYFISNVDTTSEYIASHIGHYDSRFNLFYKIDKGDRN